MKSFILAVAFISINSFADMVTVSDSGPMKTVKIESDATGIGWELFNSLREYASDFLDDYKYEYTGTGFYAVEWSKYDDDINGQAYLIEFQLDPAADNLQVDQKGKQVTVSFEGRVASALFQGLYKRRLGNEDDYEIGDSGPCAGDHYIRTRSQEIECKYATRKRADGLVEKYAFCTLNTTLD